MIKTKYLIIGNSTAAINAVEAIRERDQKSILHLVSDESCHTYSRPLISYYLGNKVGEDKLSYRPPSFYDLHNVQELLGEKAVRLELPAREVILEDQTSIQFEKLLLATGGTPFVPDTPGQDLSGVFTFTTLDDALKVKNFIAEHKVKKAVVVGGGLIGLKVTEALLALDIQVTIVELADRILSATFDRTASRVIERALKGIGCTCLTGNTVNEIREGQEGRVGSVILRDNAVVDCELVIMAIGVRPRVDLVKGTDIKINRGILVDEYLQTSVEGIYAAGDVVEGYDLLAHVTRPIAILPNAARQGKIAGTNMAGEKRAYEGTMAMNSVELAGIPTISVGLTDPSALADAERRNGMEVVQEYSEKDSIYKKIILEDNRIVGIILVGRIDRAGIYTGLIKDKVDISSFRGHLLKDDFGLLSLPREYRKHMVTGQGIEI
ncbi:MAG: FAD-dependent oxidoreductase [bacterium]